MHWWLYLFLAGTGLLQVPGHYDTLDACKAARAKAVADFRDIHTHAAAYGWCVRGGKDDLECVRQLR